MKQALREHIEAKVINFLFDMKSPAHASQIAVHIQERQEDTLHAIQRLVKNSTLKSIQDLTFLHTTGETVAYVLDGSTFQQTPVEPSLPIPLPQPASPSQRSSLS